MSANETPENSTPTDALLKGEVEVAARPNLPSLVEREDGTYDIKVKKPGDLAELFGDTNDGFGSVLVAQCFSATGGGESTLDRDGKVLELVSAMAPRDAFESLLVTQMAATHMGIMRHSKRLADATYVQTTEMHERILTKLSRTFTTQMEALRKHRNGGKQTVTVQHVNVEEGGQAIVGNVSRGEGRT